MRDLKNKNIIITGASGGIGNSIVEKLNECGANILASGTKVEKLEELKGKFNKIKILKFDISKSDKIEELIENASKELGGLDCIINNAGITQDNLAIRMSIDEWKKVIDEADVTLDLLGGGRYFQLDLDLDAEIGGSESKSSGSDYVLDGIIGGQVLYNLNERWYVSCYADVGTGDSELTWQVWPGVGYRLDSVDLVAGYRHLAWKTDDGEAIDDISFSGPMVGLKFNF